MSKVDARLILANVVSSAGTACGSMPVYVFSARKRVFSLGAVGQLPVVTGVRALEAIQLRDSVRRSQVSLFESKVVGVWPEGLPGPLSLCRPLERYGTCGLELVPPELKC